MERPLLLALGSGGAALASWSTLLLGAGGAVAHLVENATWGLVVAAVVFALLAMDGLAQAEHPRLARSLVAGGVVLAALRGAVLFMT